MRILPILALLSILGVVSTFARGASASPLEGFVDVNGVRLQYLDWGGTGPALILIHGLVDTPQVFSDLAPAFTNHFHVIAYARRGAGSSDARAPYDVETLTQDLLGLMDAFGVEKANLAGHSSGGDEINAMAAEHPERVGRIVYLDGGYDWADPDFHAAYDALPVNNVARPASAMASMDAYRSYQKEMWYRELSDTRRLEAELRSNVVIRADGTVKDRMSQDIVYALYSALWVNKPRDYTHVRCPALAIYAEHIYDPQSVNPKQRQKEFAYERDYWLPFQQKSMDRIRRELANVQVVRVPGMHISFFYTHREQVVHLMRQFLVEPPSAAAK